MALLSLFKHYFPMELNVPLLSFSCFIIVILFLLNLRTRTTKSKPNLNLPPSPPKLPIIGNLHQLGTLPHRSFGTLSKKYGPLMFLQLGQNPAVVVSSAELACEFMKTHDLTIADRPQGICPTILLYGCTDVGFGSYGSEKWKQKRKICVNELLSLRRVQLFKSVREEESGDLVKKIQDLCLSGVDSVNLSELLIATSNDIVCKCVLGDKFNTKENTRIGELARKVMINLMAFSVGDYFPTFRWVDLVTGLVPRLKAIFGELDDFFDSVIEERRNMMKNKTGDEQFSNTKSLLDILLRFQDDGTLDSQNDIKSILMDMFVGGSDTSSTAMEWAMAELVMNPTKMQKAQEEVRRIIGNKSKVEEEDINQMNYLKCVVKETLRLHPPTGLIPPRLTRSTLNVRDYTIPAKTTVFINAWAIQRTEFWERPEEFVPERFEKNDVEFKGQDFHFIPYGSGRRICPGMMFGFFAVESMLANLLYWFDWKLPTVNGVTVQHIDMEETFGLTVSKKLPLYLKPLPHY